MKSKSILITKKDENNLTCFRNVKVQVSCPSSRNNAKQTNTLVNCSPCNRPEEANRSVGSHISLCAAHGYLAAVAAGVA